MTNRQFMNTFGKMRFADNINKLSLGRSTSFYKEEEDGSETLIAKVRCDTVGVRPRKFSVTSSQAIPVGSNYTLRTIQSHLFDDHPLA